MTELVQPPVQSTVLVDNEGKASSHFYRWLEGVKTLTSQRLTRRKALTFPSTNNPAQAPFTEIPPWVKRITIMMDALSFGGTATTNNLVVQLGAKNTTYKNTGYITHYSYINANTTATSSGILGTGSANGVGFYTDYFGSVNDTRHGMYELVNLTGNIWTFKGSCTISNAPNYIGLATGAVNLGGLLDKVRLISTAGNIAFDNGNVNIMYE